MKPIPRAVPSRLRSTLILILAVWAIFYASFTLFAPPLLDDADSVHAEVAREMLLRHDYVTLYANGIRYLEKAPLLYWSMAASFKVFGVSAASARIPLALTVLALALMAETFARRVFLSTRAGLYAAVILLSSPGLFIYTRITLPDAMVCLWLTLALFAFWLTEDPSRQRCPGRMPTLIFSAACALNVLSKGLIGVVFPIAIVLLYLLLTRGTVGSLRRICQLHPWSGLAVFLALTAPWHILIALANPAEGHPGAVAYLAGHWRVALPTDGNVHGWLWFYFVNEQLLRYVNLRVPRDYDTVPLALFWGLCFVWMMPWSAFAVKALSQIGPARQSAGRYSEHRLHSLRPEARGALLLAIWAAFVLLFFSMSTRQEYYVLPALPAVAVLVGGWLAKDSRVTWQPVTRRAMLVRRANLWITAVLLALGTGFAAAAVCFLLRTRPAARHADLAGLLQQNPGDYALSLGHFLDLNAQAMGLFRLPLAIAAASLFFGPLVSYALRKRGRPHVATMALAAEAFGFLVAVHLGLQTFAPVLSSRQLASAIAPQFKPDDLIVIHQEYEFGSTLGFYLHRPSYTFASDGKPVPLNPIHILEGRSSNLWYGSFFADAPPIFETPQSLAVKWSGPRRIFLWQDLGNQPSPLPALPGPVYVIARSGGKEIVSNQSAPP